MQHSGKVDVVHEPRRPEHLVRKIEPRRRLADDPVRIRRTRRDLPRRFAIEKARVGELPVARPPSVIGRDHAALHRHCGNRDAEPFGGGVDDDRPRLRAGVAQGRPRLLDRKTAGGDRFVGARPRNGGHHAHLIQCDIELVGDDLRQRRDDPLPDLDLARSHLDESRGAKTQPLVQPAVDLQAARQLRRRAGRFAGEPDREIHCVCVSTLAAAAARSTARTIRLWAPQRQRLRSSALRTSAALGCGTRASSAAALISIPAVQ